MNGGGKDGEEFECSRRPAEKTGCDRRSGETAGLMIVLEIAFGKVEERERESPSCPDSVCESARRLVSFLIMPLRPSNRGRVVSAILVLAFFVPALTGWAADDCCMGRGHALPGLESPASPGLTANEHDGADAGPEAAPTLCSCSFCEALFARMGVPGIESPAGLDRVSALPGKIFASQALSEIFRPPLA